ncbi:DUF2637 domain-containing protein [Amycolatopsis sp. 195334CR]|uniref:DUF2637 domain-containing protein n=1 Tax=Amycolatopsis sp. 195334CR TaxID=2814588 RepID=UPI001A8C1079|nr:DUF2637 domain-containing protein [Amycolatopsis sp. 195334CR]MBN6037495.1 DUF2637 domain-containing protein [Amycolatopsis sp. 195334CR]
MRANTTPGHLSTWSGFLFGSVVSVAANVLATRIPPEGADAGWSPTLAAQIGAAVWPLALLISVEVLSRVPWPDRWTWKVAIYLGVGAVALFSAVISYQHIRDLLLHWHYPTLSASVGPLVIDGLMTAAGIGLLAVSRHRQEIANHQDQTSGATTEDQAPTIPPASPVEDPEPAPAKRPKPAPAAKRQPRPVAGDLVERARELVRQAEAAGEQVGRGRLAKELGISDHQARQVLAEARKTPLALVKGADGG